MPLAIVAKVAFDTHLSPKEVVHLQIKRIIISICMRRESKEVIKNFGGGGGCKMAERVISPGTFPSGWAGASSNPGTSNEG